MDGCCSACCLLALLAVRRMMDSSERRSHPNAESEVESLSAAAADVRRSGRVHSGLRRSSATRCDAHALEQHAHGLPCALCVARQRLVELPRGFVAEGTRAAIKCARMHASTAPATRAECTIVTAKPIACIPDHRDPRRQRARHSLQPLLLLCSQPPHSAQCIPAFALWAHRLSLHLQPRDA